jgi:hypothetical protein
MARSMYLDCTTYMCWGFLINILVSHLTYFVRSKLYISILLCNHYFDHIPSIYKMSYLDIISDLYFTILHNLIINILAILPEQYLLDDAI